MVLCIVPVPLVHIAYLRHADLYVIRFIYQHSVPDGTFFADNAVRRDIVFRSNGTFFTDNAVLLGYCFSFKRDIFCRHAVLLGYCFSFKRNIFFRQCCSLGYCFSFKRDIFCRQCCSQGYCFSSLLGQNVGRKKNVSKPNGIPSGMICKSFYRFKYIPFIIIHLKCFQEIPIFFYKRFLSMMLLLFLYIFYHIGQL